MVKLNCLCQMCLLPYSLKMVMLYIVSLTPSIGTLRGNPFMCMNLFKICVCMCGVSSCDSKLLLMVFVGSTCSIAALLNCLDHL